MKQYSPYTFIEVEPRNDPVFRPNLKFKIRARNYINRSADERAICVPKCLCGGLFEVKNCSLYRFKPITNTTSNNYVARVVAFLESGAAHALKGVRAYVHLLLVCSASANVSVILLLCRFKSRLFE